MTADLDGAIEGYLGYLRVERGLADATIRAYRSDLTDFAMSRGAALEWADGPDAAHRYLAHVQDMLHRLEATQSGAIDRAAALCADALTAGHRLFVSRDGSHALHTELVHRAGGFVDLDVRSDLRAVVRTEAADLHEANLAVAGARRQPIRAERPPPGR